LITIFWDGEEEDRFYLLFLILFVLK